MFVWDVKTGNSVKKFMGHTGKVNAVAMNLDDTVLASGQSLVLVARVCWLIIEIRMQVRSTRAFVCGISSPSFLFLALRKSSDNYSRSQQRLPIQVFEEAKDSITSIVISDSLILTGSVDGHVRTYDIRMGELRTDFFDRQSLPPPQTQNLRSSSQNQSLRSSCRWIRRCFSSRRSTRSCGRWIRRMDSYSNRTSDTRTNLIARKRHLGMVKRPSFLVMRMGRSGIGMSRRFVLFSISSFVELILRA